MPRKNPIVKLVHHDFHDPIYTAAEQANFQTELARIQKNIEILEAQLAVERAKFDGLKHLLK